MRPLLPALAVPLLFAGCEERLGPERVPTVPVSGTVLVGGVPTADVVVTLHAVDVKNEGGRYTSQPTGMTDKEGRFVISTYEQGDGVAAGTYAATFEWLTYNVLKNQWGGADKLKGRYSDPEESEYKVTINGDEDDPVVLGPYKLAK